jgi:L-glyceraldehyde 3-phosphate reductase
MNTEYIESYLPMIRELNRIAEERNQTLAQMSLAWCLRRKELASVIIGASQLEQLKDNLRALDHLDFSHESLEAIDSVLN